jgi:hypothetical protein
MKTHLLSATATFCLLPIFAHALRATDETFDYSKETLGALRLDQSADEVLKVLASEPIKGEEQEWGADGLFHQEWTFETEGITIGMVAETKGGPQTILFLRATAPCIFPTASGVMIGSSKEDVLKAYGSAVNPEESSNQRIVVGSIYGGAIFELKDGSVNSIFIGAAAE